MDDHPGARKGGKATGKAGGRADRKERLAGALRANLKRRKQAAGATGGSRNGNTKTPDRRGE